MNDRISRIRKTPMSQVTDEEAREFILDGGGRTSVGAGGAISRLQKSHSGRDISKNLKRLKFVEEQIASNPEASKSYKALRANGLSNTVRFAELIDWVVMTRTDEKRLGANL